MNKELQRLYEQAGFKDESDAKAWRLRPGLPSINLRGQVWDQDRLQQYPGGIAQVKLAWSQPRDAGKDYFNQHFYDTRVEKNPQPYNLKETPVIQINRPSKATTYTPPAYNPAKFGKTPDPELGQRSYSIVIDGLEIVIGGKVPETENAVTAQIWQVYFQPEQQQNLLEGTTPYYNHPGGKWLESGVIRDVFENKKGFWKIANYVGVLSHRWPEKYKGVTTPTAETLAHLIRSGQNKQGSLSPVLNLWNAKHPKTDKWILKDGRIRPNTEAIFELLLPEIGIDLKLDTRLKTLRHNSWLMTPEAFTHYCTTVLIPAMEACESNSKIRTLMEQRANYAGKATEAQLQQVFGVPHYTYHPFIAELLPMIWFAANSPSGVGLGLPVRALDVIKL